MVHSSTHITEANVQSQVSGNPQQPLQFAFYYIWASLMLFEVVNHCTAEVAVPGVSWLCGNNNTLAVGGPINYGYLTYKQSNTTYIPPSLYLLQQQNLASLLFTPSEYVNRTKRQGDYSTPITQSLVEQCLALDSPYWRIRGSLRYMHRPFSLWTILYWSLGLADLKKGLAIPIYGSPRARSTARDLLLAGRSLWLWLAGTTLPTGIQCSSDPLVSTSFSYTTK